MMKGYHSCLLNPSTALYSYLCSSNWNYFVYLWNPMGVFLS